MGAYSQNLRRRISKTPEPQAPIDPNIERLIGVGIVRDGMLNGKTGHIRSHYELRSAMDDIDPGRRQHDDVEGFITNQGRFLTRREAAIVAFEAGQVRDISRELLSSDIKW